MAALELLGKTVLISRPRGREAELRAALERRGATVLFQPAIEILPPENWVAVDDSRRAVESGEFDAIVFSSSNGVRFWLDRLDASWGEAPQDVLLNESGERAFDVARRTIAARREEKEENGETFEERIAAQSPFLTTREATALAALRRAAFDETRRDFAARRELFARYFPERGVSVVAVGPGTAAALAERGVGVDLIPDEHNAEGVVAALVRESGPRGVAGKRVLSIRASRGRDVLRIELEKLGATVREVAAYRSVDVETPEPEIAAAFESGRVDFAVATSSATFKSLVKMFGESAARKVGWVAIGPPTARTIRDSGFEPVGVAEESTPESLADAVVGAVESRK